jgi:copper homeostasis protein
MKKKTLIEVCVDSVESALAAEDGGADRVELCDNLLEGGTTPSYAAIELARKRLKIGLQVIVRPRGGDFLYSPLEFEIIKRDVEIARDLGADGIVIGMLAANGAIDRRTAELIEAARPLAVTFHRAFDVSRDPCASLRQLIDLGVERVLTSGQEATAFEGIDLIAELVELAGTRITIIGCGGLTARNVGKFVAATGVSEVHLTGFESRESRMRFRNRRVYMGGALRPAEFSRLVTSSETVSQVLKELQ